MVSLVILWTLNLYTAEHQYSRTGFSKKILNGNSRTNLNFGSHPFVCFCFISGGGLTVSVNLSGKYQKSVALTIVFSLFGSKGSDAGPIN